MKHTFNVLFCTFLLACGQGDVPIAEHKAQALPASVMPAEDAPRTPLDLAKQTRDQWKTKGPIDVLTPAPNTPEATLFLAMQSAIAPNEEAGWAQFEPLLDPNGAATTAKAIRSWREFNFAAFRRKAHLYTIHDGHPAFRIAYAEPQADGDLKVFVVNEQSMPTPCQLRQHHDGPWRITTCGL